MFPLLALALAQPEFASAELKTAHLALTAYAPDTKNGYYRGTRFDHAGVIGLVKFAGSTLFTPWKDKHEPTNNDDILGPVEEFAPIGYGDANVGEVFHKIGVGDLEKIKEDNYHFSHPYKLRTPVGWKETLREKDQIEWACAVASKAGCGYRYTKRIRLFPNGADFDITHTLANVHTVDLVADVYNHNFFNVDGDPVGPNYSIAFPEAAKATKPEGIFATATKLDAADLTLSRLLGKDFIMAGFQSAKGTPFDGKSFIVKHAKTGIRMTVTQTVPIVKFNLWSVSTAFCPEPYARIVVPPNQTKTWTILYRFAKD